MQIYDMSKVKGRIIEKYGSQRNFAKKIKRSQAFVSGVLNGKAYLEQRDISLWAECLDITEPELPAYFFTKKVHEIEQIC